MSDRGSKYAMAALKQKRASLAGEIEQLKRQIAYREEQLAHVDATIAVFEPGYDAGDMRPKMPRRVKLFRQGELNRLILGALRSGGEMSTAEVVTAVMAALGYDETARAALAPRVRANLQYLLRRNGTVAKMGEGRAANWKITSLNK